MGTLTDSLSKAVRQACEHALDVVHPRLLPARRHGDARLRQGHPRAALGPVRLSHDDRLAILVRRVRQRRLQRAERRAGAVERVEGEAHDVELARLERAGDEDAVEEVAHARPVPAVRDVDQDLRRARRLRAAHGRVEQLRRRVEAVDGDLPDGPEQAVVDLVSDLQDVDGRALVREALHDVHRVPAATRTRSR